MRFDGGCVGGSRGGCDGDPGPLGCSVLVDIVIIITGGGFEVMFLVVFFVNVKLDVARDVAVFLVLWVADASMAVVGACRALRSLASTSCFSAAAGQTSGETTVSAIYAPYHPFSSPWGNRREVERKRKTYAALMRRRLEGG